MNENNDKLTYLHLTVSIFILLRIVHALHAMFDIFNRLIEFTNAQEIKFSIKDFLFAFLLFTPL